MTKPNVYQLDKQRQTKGVQDRLTSALRMHIYTDGIQRQFVTFPTMKVIHWLDQRHTDPSTFERVAEWEIASLGDFQEGTSQEKEGLNIHVDLMDCLLPLERRGTIITYKVRPSTFPAISRGLIQLGFSPLNPEDYVLVRVRTVCFCSFDRSLIISADCQQYPYRDLVVQ